jgi:hypothetical protein
LQDLDRLVSVAMLGEQLRQLMGEVLVAGVAPGSQDLDRLVSVAMLGEQLRRAEVPEPISFAEGGDGRPTSR